MSVVAIVTNGVWTQVDDPARDLTDVLQSPVDQIVAHLGQVVRLAQGLSPTDARRARDLVLAVEGMLRATTYLPEQDQRQFERALRERVR